MCIVCRIPVYAGRITIVSFYIIKNYNRPSEWSDEECMKVKWTMIKKYYTEVKDEDVVFGFSYFLGVKAHC